MNIINLEIDSRIKKLLHKALTQKGIVGISFHSQKPKHQPNESDNLQDEENCTMTVKVYAEAEEIGKIIKTIVSLGRDGLTVFPIKVQSIMQLNPC